MHMPKTTKNAKTHRLNLVLPVAIWKRIQFWADVNRRSVTQEILFAVTEHMAHLQKELDKELGKAPMTPHTVDLPEGWTVRPAPGVGVEYLTTEGYIIWQDAADSDGVRLLAIAHHQRGNRGVPPPDDPGWIWLKPRSSDGTPPPA